MQDASTIDTTTAAASTLQLLGAGCFGALIGWHLYFINRYRTSDVKIADLAELVGIIGGGAVLSLFEAKTDLFGAYGIGLLAGFVAYLLLLIVMVNMTDKFGVEWFLDGRRKDIADGETIGAVPTTHPMTLEERSRP